MRKVHKIIICHSNKDKEEVECCPFRKTGEVNENWLERNINILKTGTCSINGIDCVYGLTDIHVPEKCPLKIEGDFIGTYTFLK